MPSPTRQAIRGFLVRHPNLIVVVTAVMALFILGVTYVNLRHERDDVREHATENAENIALIIERDVTRNQQLLDLSLQAVIEGVQDPAVMKLPSRYRRRVLFDRSVSEGPYVGASVYVDAHGEVVTEARSDIPRVVNFADLAWFRVHHAHSDAGLYISAPYPLRLHNHKLGIVMSRRVNHSDGSFAGVAATSIDLDYFERLLSGLKVGHQGVITLMQPDGTIVMRTPGRQAWVGKSLLHSTNFQRYQRWHERSFVGLATSDGVERMFVLRQFKNAPFVISVGLGTEDIYANWREKALRVAGLMVLLSAGLLAAAWLLAQEFKHRLTVEKSLSLLARQDGLTGLNNRRTLDEVYQRELKRADRTGSPLSMLFVDIDHFKQYNDTYGHQAGDAALTCVAGAIAHGIKRPQDIAARFGGEEFVIILPDTTLDDAKEVARRIQSAVAGLHIEHLHSELTKLTVSIGYACSHELQETEQTDLMQAADQALYQAKTAGRNQIMAYQTQKHVENARSVSLE